MSIVHKKVLIYTKVFVFQGTLKRALYCTFSMENEDFEGPGSSRHPAILRSWATVEIIAPLAVSLTILVGLKNRILVPICTLFPTVWNVSSANLPADDPYLKRKLGWGKKIYTDDNIDQLLTCEWQPAQYYLTNYCRKFAPIVLARDKS